MYKNPNGTVEILEKTIEEIESGELTDLVYIKEALEWLKHERLVHLIVTVFVGIILFIVLALTLTGDSVMILLLMTILLVLEFFYLYHYYRLENGVQKLNKLYLSLLRK